MYRNFVRKFMNMGAWKNNICCRSTLPLIYKYETKSQYFGETIFVCSQSFTTFCLLYMEIIVYLITNILKRKQAVVCKHSSMTCKILI